MSFVSATLGLPPISRHGSSPPPAEHRASALTGTPFQMGGCAGDALSEVYRAPTAPVGVLLILGPRPAPSPVATPRSCQ